MSARSFSPPPRSRFVLPAIAVLLFSASCDDPSGPGTDVVTTLLVFEVPEAPIRVGSTAQLVATALSASGSVISGANVTWKSSDEAVARVSGGLVTATGAGVATIEASSGRGSATVDISVVAPLTLDKEGGTASLPDGSLSIEIPPGHLTGPATYLVAPVPDSAADEGSIPGTTYDIRLEDGTGYLFPEVTITLRYDPSRLPREVSAGALQLYHFTEHRWKSVLSSRSDPGANHVSGRLYGMGRYAVRPSPVRHVHLAGTLLDGALYVTQTTVFRAAAFAEAGDTLHSAELRWSSSAANVATVDDAGTVTALSPGTVTITATSGEVTASTEIQVLDRPIATGTSRHDWSTYRGNNQRTGFVDAALDPVRFERLWEASLPPGPFHEPATADGNVYLSTDSYWGSQTLWALDASTGGTRWTRAFGEIRSVNGPAAAEGGVYVSTGGHDDSFLWNFHAADGELRFRSPYENQWARWKAPAIEDGTVYMGGGYYGGMYAFTSQGGVELWSLSLPQADGWTVAVDNGTVYAFNDEGLLTINAISKDTTVKLGNQGLPHAGTPVIDGDDLFVTDGYRLLALDVRRERVLWSTPGPYQEIPSVDEEHVYAVVDGKLEVRDREDGSLVWSWSPQDRSTVGGTLIVTRNLLFVQILNLYEESGRVMAFDLRARKAVWSYEEGGQMALANGMLIITSRSSGKVVAIGVE